MSTSSASASSLPLRDVDPDEPVRARQQRGQLVERLGADAAVAHPPQLHAEPSRRRRGAGLSVAAASSPDLSCPRVGRRPGPGQAGETRCGPTSWCCATAPTLSSSCRTRPAASAFLLRVGRTDQSYVDLEDPLRLEFDYVQRIADLIEALFEPARTLRAVHVGGAGLTLPRYVAATRPGSVQTVLEPDAELTDFVRSRLPLPRASGIKVRAVDGRAGMPELRDQIADLVVLDAFVGRPGPAGPDDGRRPRRRCTACCGPTACWR